MDLEFLHTKDKEKVGINNFLKSFVHELKKFLNKSPSFVIDRFEGDIAVCENQNDGKMIDISINLISDKATEGMTIKFEKDKYVIDYQNCILTRKSIVDKLKQSWEKEEGAEYYIVSSVLEKVIKCSNIYMKQNIYIKDESFIELVKKGDIIKYIDEKYVIDYEKNKEVNNKIEEII